MGLIKAFTSSVKGTIGDQYKEYVTCPEMDSNTLLVRGEVHHGAGNNQSRRDGAEKPVDAG